MRNIFRYSCAGQGVLIAKPYNSFNNLKEKYIGKSHLNHTRNENMCREEPCALEPPLTKSFSYRIV